MRSRPQTIRGTLARAFRSALVDRTVFLSPPQNPRLSLPHQATLSVGAHEHWVARVRVGRGSLLLRPSCVDQPVLPRSAVSRTRGTVTVSCSIAGTLRSGLRARSRGRYSRQAQVGDKRVSSPGYAGYAENPGCMERGALPLSHYGLKRFTLHARSCHPTSPRPCARDDCGCNQKGDAIDERGSSGAGSGNRTRVFSLEGCCSTIELYPRPFGRQHMSPRRPGKALSTGAPLGRGLMA